MKPKAWVKTGILVCVLLVSGFSGAQGETMERPSLSEVAEEYIGAWRDYYPTRAWAAGDRGSAFRFEDYSSRRIREWVGVNRRTLGYLEECGSGSTWDQQVDRRILGREIRKELNIWEEELPLKRSSFFYSGGIGGAMTHLMARRGDFEEARWVQAIRSRLIGIKRLAERGIGEFSGGGSFKDRMAAENLEHQAGFLGETLFRFLEEEYPKNQGVRGLCRKTADAVQRLSVHIREKAGQTTDRKDALGFKMYSKGLKVYTGLDITPAGLETDSLAEIEKVRDLIMKRAVEYVGRQKGMNPGPEEALRMALGDMESHRCDNRGDFLNSFRQLIQRAEKFLRDRKIATLPERRTLITALSPSYFYGAGVGGVYPAGPFDPDADTLFFLPSISDQAETERKTGFYRSFNNHFNTMIITHEIYPGHYLHLKRAAHHPSMVRSLFGSDLFAEGWATLCEELTLEAGWDDGNPLTWLAHLRKRLENAVRAYTSVQVHCRGWNRERMTGFASDRGLMPPQFTRNLWRRVMASPFQLTSYYLGSRYFRRVYREQKRRLGRNFSLKEFSDRILGCGSIPVDQLEELFGNFNP